MRSQTAKPLTKKGALGKTTFKTSAAAKQTKKKVSPKKLKTIQKSVAKSPKKNAGASESAKVGKDGEQANQDKPGTSADTNKPECSKTSVSRENSPSKKAKKDVTEKKDKAKAACKKVVAKKSVKTTKSKLNSKLKIKEDDDAKYKINLDLLKRDAAKSKAKSNVKKGSTANIKKKDSEIIKQTDQTGDEKSKEKIPNSSKTENKIDKPDTIDEKGNENEESKLSVQVENKDNSVTPTKATSATSNSSPETPKVEHGRPPKFFISSRSPRTVDIDVKCCKNSKGNLSVSERFLSMKCETKNDDGSAKNTTNNLISQGPEIDVYTFTEKVDSPKSILSDFRSPVNKNVGRVRPIARVKGTVINKKSDPERKKYSPHRPIEEVVKQLKAKRSEDVVDDSDGFDAKGLGLGALSIEKEFDESPKPIVSKSYKMVARKSSITGKPFSPIHFPDQDDAAEKSETKHAPKANNSKKIASKSKSQPKKTSSSDDEIDDSTFSLNKSRKFTSSDESLSDSNDDIDSKESSGSDNPKNKKTKNKKYKRITDSAKKKTSKELKELSKDSLIDIKDATALLGNEKPSKRRLKLLSMWSGPKRHRMASLNAIAKVHCLYENESRSHMELGLMKTVDNRPVMPSTSKQSNVKKRDTKQKEIEKQDSTSESEYESNKKDKEKDSSESSDDSNPPQRTLRGVPGIRSAGKYWDPKSSTSSSDDSELESKPRNSSAEKKKSAKSTSPKSETEKPSKMKKTAGVPVKKKRIRNEVVMDLKDMVVQKRMASLNATAILAASYEKRSPKSSKDDSTSDSCSDESYVQKPKNGVGSGVKSEIKNEEPKKEPEEPTVSDTKQKVEVIVNQDTDVTITGVYSTHHHEGFCTVSGMQYRISSTSHTQTTATANCEKEGCSRDDNRYTPLSALSSMKPPADHPHHPVPELGGLTRRPGCSSAFSAPSPAAHHDPDPKTIPGYEQQLEEVHDGLLPASPSPCAPTQTIISSTSDKASDDVPYTPELPPEILYALGDSTDDITDFGEDIHPNLAERWTPILRKGLDGDLKAKLMAEYKIPANCTLLKSPTINPEISVAITGALKARDKKLETAQHQLGLGISALNKAMTLLLTSEDKIQAIKILSDLCRILSDLHHIRTDHRVSLLTPSLDKSFLDIVEGREKDLTLFGKDLSDKIKTAKVIEKQGLQIKKSVLTTATSMSLAFTSRGRAVRETGQLLPTSLRTGGGAGEDTERTQQQRTSTRNAERRRLQSPPPPAGTAELRAPRTTNVLLDVTSSGYYQPAGPLIKEGEERALARYHPPHYHPPHPPVLPQYGAPYYPAELCYGRYYRPPGYHMTPPQSDAPMVGVGSEPYPPQYYGSPPCYQHSPQRIPYMEYRGCPCPLNACPKNVLIGPATGKAPASGGPDVPSVLAPPGAAFRPKVWAGAHESAADTHGSGKDPPLEGEPPMAADAPHPCPLPAIGGASPKREMYDVRENLRLNANIPGPTEAIGPPSPARGACAPQPPAIPRRARLGKAMARRSLAGDDTGLLISVPVPPSSNTSDDDVLAISPPVCAPIDLSSSDERSTPLVDIKKENEGPTITTSRKTDAQALKEHNSTTTLSDNTNCTDITKPVKRRHSRPKLEIDMKDALLLDEDVCKTNGIGEHVKLQKRRKVSGDQTDLRVETSIKEQKKKVTQTTKKSQRKLSTEKRAHKRKSDLSLDEPVMKKVLNDNNEDNRVNNISAISTYNTNPKHKSALLLDNLLKKNGVDAKGQISETCINPAELFLTPSENLPDKNEAKKNLNINNNIVENKTTVNGVRPKTIAAVSQLIGKKLAYKNACKVDSKVTSKQKTVLTPASIPKEIVSEAKTNDENNIVNERLELSTENKCTEIESSKVNNKMDDISKPIKQNKVAKTKSDVDKTENDQKHVINRDKEQSQNTVAVESIAPTNTDSKMTFKSKQAIDKANGELKGKNVEKLVKLLASKRQSREDSVPTKDIEVDVSNDKDRVSVRQRVKSVDKNGESKAKNVEKVVKLLVSKRTAIKSDEASLVVEDACATPVRSRRRRNVRRGRRPIMPALPDPHDRAPPRWSNGWTWDGDHYLSKVYLNNDSRLDRTARCYSRMSHASGDRVSRGDCVLLRASQARAQPFVARVASLWENPDDGEMMMSLVWYYRPEHTERGRVAADAPDEVFASRHRDANSVACIEDKCYVLTFNEYCRYKKRLKAAEEGITVTSSIVPALPPSEVTPALQPNDTKLPPSVSPELVLFCRKIYDFRSKKIQVPNK